ncbi:hypothetical protein GAMM_60147 [Gammaproteobacteria bacterium]
MIKLTKIETLTISGGDMECFCIPKGANAFDVDLKPVRETLGDIDAVTCAQTCCGWLVNAGWDFCGPDAEISMSPIDYHIESKPGAVKGNCTN